MFDPAAFQTLFAYHAHTQRQLLASAAELDPAAYHRHPGYGHGALHDLFLHGLRTDAAWRIGLETGQQPAPLPADQFPTLAAVQAGLEAEKHAWQTLLAGLVAAALTGTINLTSQRGTVHAFTRWRVLQHVVLHGMQHHAEIAQLLTAAGRSPGNIDFIFYR